jgi:hypothetical protein
VLSKRDIPSHVWDFDFDRDLSGTPAMAAEPDED